MKRDVSPQVNFGKGDTKRRRRAELASEHEVEVKEAFDLFDPHKTAFITYHELKVILRALGFDVKKSEVVQLAREFDVEETGKVSFEDYLEIMRRKYGERDPIEETLKAFRLFDLEGKGKISLADLRRVGKELGEALKEEELAAMIE
jgi:centrin-3